MRRHRLYILLFLTGIALTFPTVKTIKAYQDMLWTNDASFRGRPTGDFVFKGSASVEGIRSWRRIQLGLPLKATTCDTLPGVRGATQIRIERDALFLNLLAAFVLWLLFFSRIFVGRGITIPPTNAEGVPPNDR